MCTITCIPQYKYHPFNWWVGCLLYTFSINLQIGTRNELYTSKIIYPHKLISQNQHKQCSKQTESFISNALFLQLMITRFLNVYKKQMPLLTKICKT